MDTELVNSLVYDYMNTVSAKLAEKFKKETNLTKQLPSGSPAIGEVIKHFHDTSNTDMKRKIETEDSSTQKIKKVKQSAGVEANDSECETGGEKIDGEAETGEENTSAESSQPTEKKKIFIKNVGKESVYEDFKDKVEQFGKVTEFSNSGRGFCFLTFSSLEASNACIAALNNTEVAGQTVQMNIAKHDGKDDTAGADSSQPKTVVKSVPANRKRIFIRNVGKESVYEDFEDKVEKFGKVTYFSNSGRGFCFLTFTSSEAANACVAALNNTVVAGKTIQMNIAREEAKFGASDKDVLESDEGCKLFVHGVKQETDSDKLKEVFEKFGKVTDSFNPGKGFAFVTFSTPEEAIAAVEALNGKEVFGHTISVNVSKPKVKPEADKESGKAAKAKKIKTAIESVRLFVSNVNENTSQDDLKAAFAGHGTVTDAYNPGKGFAFVNFATADEAQAAIDALSGKEVCGQVIECNIAKFKKVQKAKAKS